MGVNISHRMMTTGRNATRSLLGVRYLRMHGVVASCVHFLLQLMSNVHWGRPQRCRTGCGYYRSLGCCLSTNLGVYTGGAAASTDTATGAFRILAGWGHHIIHSVTRSWSSRVVILRIMITAKVLRWGLGTGASRHSCTHH